MTGRLPPSCSWTDRCVGLDETAEGPVAVMAVRRGRSVTLEPATGPVTGAALAVGLSEREAWIRRVPTPLQSRDQALGVLPGLLDVQLPFGLEECVYACVGGAREKSGWTLTAAVVRKSDLQARLTRLAGEGHEPHHVDQEGLALWTQALMEHPAAGPGPRAVVYLGSDRSVLAFGRGADLLSTHGLKKFEPAQALRLARLAFDGAGEAEWLWAGPLAEQAERVAEWAAAVNPGKPPVIMGKPRFVLARAYAIRALTAGPLRCDFRQGGELHPDVRSWQTRRAVFSVRGWLAAGLVMLLGGLAWEGLLAGRLAGVDRQVQAEARRFIPPSTAVPAGGERAAMEQAYRRAREELEPFATAQGSTLGRGLGRLLMTAREEKVTLYRLAWSAGAVQVEGRADSEEAVRRLAADFERTAAQAVAVKVDPKGEHDVRFSLEGAP